LSVHFCEMAALRTAGGPPAMAARRNELCVRLRWQMTSVTLIMGAGIATSYEMLLLAESQSPWVGRVLHSLVCLGLIVALCRIIRSAVSSIPVLLGSLWTVIKRKYQASGPARLD
jgi:hypothetical protein